MVLYGTARKSGAGEFKVQNKKATAREGEKLVLYGIARKSGVCS